MGFFRTVILTGPQENDGELVTFECATKTSLHEWSISNLKLNQRLPSPLQHRGHSWIFCFSHIFKSNINYSHSQCGSNIFQPVTTSTEPGRAASKTVWETLLHDHPCHHVCPDVLGLVGEPLSGDGCDSPNHIQFQLFSFTYLLFHFILDIKKACCIQLNKSFFIKITRSLVLLHIALVRDCFPHWAASVRYRLPAVS